MKKAFDNYDNKLTIHSSNDTSTLAKFALKAFKWLSYNRETSRFLIASYLLNLPNYFSPKAIVKTNNITFLQVNFLWILDGKNFNQSDHIVRVDDIKVRLCSIYKHYIYRSSAFIIISIYKYWQFVFIVKQSQ